MNYLPRNILEKFRPHKAENDNRKLKWPPNPGPAIGYRLSKQNKQEEVVLSPKKVLFPNGIRIWSYWYQHPWLGTDGKIKNK